MTENILVECVSCNATGLYRGFLERKGCPVTCQTCKGTGAIAKTVFKGKREYKELH